MRICVSLTEETTDGVIERMHALAGVADLFEVRADLVLDLDLLAILRARVKPLMLTCRAESEGGRWADDDPRRRLTLLEGVKRGYDYVDIEHRSGLVDVMNEKAGRGLVVSYHDMTGMPADLDTLYAEMCERRADVVKIAVTPRSVADVGRVLAFARRAAAGGGPPVVAIAMGPLGIATRILSGRHGAPFTFASASAGAESAPGQIPASLMAGLFRVGSLTSATRVYGVLGSDVTGSLSPVLHNRAFEARGIDAVYVPLQADSLDGFMKAMPALDLSGFSVTRPYKVDILAHMQEVEESGGGLREREHGRRAARRHAARLHHRRHRGARVPEETRGREGAPGGHPRGRGRRPLRRVVSGQQRGEGGAVGPRREAGGRFGPGGGLPPRLDGRRRAATRGTSSSMPPPSGRAR